MEIEDKIMTIDQAVAWRKRLKEQGKKVVFTNGVFDLLHRGHVTYLSQAAKVGDALIVAINSDASVHELKGPTRPIVPEEERAFLLASLACVDAVVIFDGKMALEPEGAIRPDIYVKGGDYTEETLAREEHALLKTFVEKFVFLPFVQGKSTTERIRFIRGEQLNNGKTTEALQLNPKLNLFWGRRSVRKFQDRLVSDELIKDLLQAAMAAPTAKGMQTWKIIVLKTQESKQNVADILPFGKYLPQAGVGFIVCGDLNKVCGGHKEYLIQDCSAATENILLAARALSLGGCWLGVNPIEERMTAIRELFQLPENIVPVSAIAVGWPAEEPPARTRFSEDDVMVV